MPRVRLDPQAMFFVLGSSDGVGFIELHLVDDPSLAPAPVVVRDEVPTRSLYRSLVRFSSERSAR